MGASLDKCFKCEEVNLFPSAHTPNICDACYDEMILEERRSSPEGFHYVDVKSPGAEGTINLFFGPYVIQWVSDPAVASEMKDWIDKKNE